MEFLIISIQSPKLTFSKNQLRKMLYKKNKKHKDVFLVHEFLWAPVVELEIQKHAE